MNKNALFYKDSSSNLEKSYQDLLHDIQGEAIYYRYCKSNSYYDIFKSIILSLLMGEEVILLDADFSTDEVEKLVGDTALLQQSVDNPFYQGKRELTLELLFDALQHDNISWNITLFTSGTTGLPKKISHTLGSIARFVKRSEKHASDVWGFCYNPTHMAGLQVFFQALFNQNPIIRLFGLDRDMILSQIGGYQITNLSATPTFYRLLLPVSQILASVQRLTSGGEKFDAKTIAQLQTMFPNAKITNVYASTEAGTLFASQGDLFTIKESITDSVKIVDQELYLHSSLMGQSSAITLQGDWYATGDLIEVITSEPLTFKFLSRKNEMINVGGYKVNPTEVEDVIRQYPDVVDVFVYGKKNSLLGNIICCEIVRSCELVKEPLLREFLRERLQEFKIPRMMKFVEQLQTTRTGKLSRNK